MQVDDILFNALKHERQKALASIKGWAEACDLQVDGIEERPKRLSVDLRVRVERQPSEHRHLLPADKRASFAGSATHHPRLDRRND